MARDVQKFESSALPKAIREHFSAEAVKDDLSGGVQSSFGVISFRGSKWRVKYQGNETLITNNDGDAVGSLKLVLLNALPKLSKIYYKGSYQEGDDSPPDCFSVDGVKPDPSSPKKQSETCAECPHNVWGSRITPAGKKTKACQDSRRVAVVPEGDLENEQFGGPVLLRVPAASLANLAEYSNALRQKGWPYFAVVTKVGFDPDAAYPKLTFRPERPLSDDEAETVIDLRTSDQVQRILSEAKDMTHEVAPKVPEGSSEEDEGDDPFAALGDGPMSAKADKPKKAAKAKQPEPEEDDEGEDEDEPQPKAKKGRNISDAPEDRDDEDEKPKKAAKAKKAKPAEEHEVASDALEDELEDLLSDFGGDE